MENNIVLYRKYRPQTFGEIIGQDLVVQTLKNAIKVKTTSHAYLFCGPRGSGKTSIARIFAKAINCQKLADSEPCNQCDSCKEIMGANAMDLVEIDAASHTGVDDVRALIEGIAFAPVKSRYKIFIIDECHQLSKAASNALLKTLEEPPAHVIFMLATTEAHKMIATIISRCQRFDLKRLQTPEITKKLEFILKKEKLGYEPAALSLIALHARGSFRDAESILDQCIHFLGQDGKITAGEIKELLGIVETKKIGEFVSALIAKDAVKAVQQLNAMAEKGVDLLEFAKTLVFYLRQMLLVKIYPQGNLLEQAGFSAEESETIKNQAEKLEQKEIQRMLELFMEADQKMKYAAIMQLPLELAVMDITHKE